MNMISVKSGEGRYGICLQVQDTAGRGLSGFLFGGETPHVGGVALACPRAKSQGTGLTSDLWLISVPLHKDIQIAQQVAQRICVAVNEPVAITAGIHIEHATQDEVKLLCEHCLAAADLFVRVYVGEAEN